MGNFFGKLFGELLILLNCHPELERELRDKICEPLLKMHNYFPEAPGPAICCSPIMTTVLAMHKVCNLGQSWIDFGPTPDCQGWGRFNPAVTTLC